MDIDREIRALRKLTTRELQTKYVDVFGEGTPANHRIWLIKRIAWRLQALVEGDLSARARRRAEELANDADIRSLPPRPALAANSLPAASASMSSPRARRRNGRLPLPGTVLTRRYKGRSLQVKVLKDGFEFEGSLYASLSAVAKAVTGTHTSGWLFFRMNQAGGRP
jgi:hypothetical protein